EISERWFGRTVIHSDKRFTYEEVWDILQASTKESPWGESLTMLNKLAYKLREKKFEAGAIAFETDEIKFKLDAAGKPIEVYKKTRNDAHLLVEDFMLLANRSVAEYVSALVKDADNHFVYRIHDLPDPDKLAQLAAFLRPLGYELPLRGEGIRSSDLNKFLKSVEGKPEQNMIQTSVMRSMSKAIYAMKNIGHYGLAFAHYTHFTSPIRRYPDVMVHRLLQIYLDGKKPDEKMLKDYYELCFYTSQKELEAQDAERDSIKYKQVEYLAPKIGQTFDALISGVSKWGVYVEEKEAKAEGMVRLFEMKDDFYVFDEKNYCLSGQNSGKRYRLGDLIKVKLLKADLKLRILDFAFA
ncbi:MAG: RNB domain-containing ribonuclease, partial [Patescibacteria group bacterium]